MIGLGLSLSSTAVRRMANKFKINVPPVVSGTLGSTLTCIPALAHKATSLSYQWYQDNLPIPGQTGTTLNGALYPGNITCGVTATSATGAKLYAMSAIFPNGSSAELKMNETFEGATNNQIYSTLSGRTLTVAGGDVTNQNKILIKKLGGVCVLGSTSGITTITNANGQNTTALLYANTDLGINHRVEIDCNKLAAPATSTPNIVLRYVDEFNYLLFRNTSGVFNIVTVNNGVQTDIARTALGATANPYYHPSNPPNTSFTSTYTLRVDVTGSIFKVYEKIDNATTFTQLPLVHLGSPDSVLMYDYDMSANNNLTLPQGRTAGLWPGGSTSGVDNVRFYALDAPVLITSTSTTSSNNSPTITINAQYSGTVDPTGFDVAVIAKSGLPILPRTAATVTSLSGGLASMTITSPLLRGAEGSTCYVQIWKTGTGQSGNEGYAYSHNMPVYQTVFPYRQGINDGFPSGNISEPYRDLFKAVDMRTGINQYNSAPSTLQYNKNGLPLTLDPAHTDGFTFVLHPNLSLPADRVGTYIITYPAAYTIGSTAAAIDYVGLPNANCPVGYTQARYTRAQSTTLNPLIWFNGLTGNVFGPNDSVTIVMENDPHPERAIPDSVANTIGSLGSVYRPMEGRYQNFAIYKATAPTVNTKWSAADYPLQKNSNTQRVPPITAELAAGAANQANCDLHFNAIHTCDESYWRLEARAVAQTLSPNLKCQIEWANEPWNNSFPSYNDATVEGIRLGFGDANSTTYAIAANVASTLPNVYYTTGNYDSNLAYTPTTVFVPSGSLVVGGIHNKGILCYRALHDNAIGTPLPADETGSADWSPAIYNNSDCGTARQRYQSYCSDRLLTIWTEEFAAAGRTDKPTLTFNVQTGNSLGTAVQNQLTWVGPSGIPLYKRLSKLAVAPYWAAGYGTGNLGYYLAPDMASPPYAHPWTSVEKGLVATDLNAFLTAFFAVAYDGIDYTISQLWAFKNSLANWLVSQGASPDAIEMMSYECNWGVTFYGWPSNLKDAANAAFASIIRDARYGAATSYYLKQLATKIGGTHIIYNRIGAMPTSGSDKATVSAGPEQNWSLMDFETDNATSGGSQNYRFTAVVNAKNGIFS